MSTQTEHFDNVDESEVAKFNALASRWWDPQGDFRPLHEINPLRLDWIRQHVSLEGKNVLDVGCGGGILTEAMAAADANVTGIDFSQRSIDYAQKFAVEKNLDITYHCQNYLYFDTDKRFDLIVMIFCDFFN